MRTAVGSSAQLTTFSKTKDLLVEYEFFAESIFFTALGASMVSGLFTAVAMTPFDVVATRMFNQGLMVEFIIRAMYFTPFSTGVDAQGKGLMYKNIIDCFIKTLRVEGFWALYKGFLANYCRLAPHTILNLTFWEQFKRWKDMYYNKVVYFE